MSALVVLMVVVLALVFGVLVGACWAYGEIEAELQGMLDELGATRWAPWQ